MEIGAARGPKTVFQAQPFERACDVEALVAANYFERFASGVDKVADQYRKTRGGKPVSRGMGQYGDASRATYPPDHRFQTSPGIGDVRGLAIAEIRAKRLAQVGNAAAFNEVSREMDPSRCGPRGDTCRAFQSVFDTDPTQAFGDAAGALKTCVPLLLDAFPQQYGSRVDGEAQYVDGAVSPKYRELDTRNDLECRGNRDPGIVGGNSVMVGDRQRGDAVHHRACHELGGAQSAI